MKVKVQHPEYVMFSSDYSQQEPRLAAAISGSPVLIQGFIDGKDVYATIASVAFNKPYEQCLEFHPETHEYQPDGKERRTQAKSIVLGILYGRSTVTIGEQLFGRNKEMSDEDKTKAAQHVYDSVMNAFPELRQAMHDAQESARTRGFTETIFGRRRHIPDMQLPEFEFKALPGYVNPDVDPLDVSTLQNSSEIPERVVKQLETEFSKLKYYGQVVKRTKELRAEHIKVINNRRKITDASRQCLNCVDYNTEILTLGGWKSCNEVRVGDTILSYNMDKQVVELDNVRSVFNYPGTTPVVRFKSQSFDAVSTENHRWVCRGHNSSSVFVETSHIEQLKWPDYPIIRVADNNMPDNGNLSDGQLQLIGWLMTDGSYYKPGRPYHMNLCQSTKRPKGQKVYQHMVDTLSKLGYTYSDSCNDDNYHTIYVFKNEFFEWVRNTFPDRVLTFSFVSTLSQHQALVLMQSMMEGDGWGTNLVSSFTCGTVQKRDVFQYLCFKAGYCTNSYTYDDTNRKSYGNVTNKSGYIQSTKPHYVVKVLKYKVAQIYDSNKSRETCDGVWCVSTGNGTWVARRDGKVFITGNSEVQGSAADMTKIALLNLQDSSRWNQIGGRTLVPVHDEIICEVPVDFYEEGSELLKTAMESAGDFLPFPIYCDVETTLRWYGLEFPCPYDKPTHFSLSDLDSMNERELEWIQYHLLECEYQLPTFPDKDGNAPIGNAAKGISGKVSKEMVEAIKGYMDEYQVSEESFVSHIECLVQKGIVSHAV